MFQIRKTQSLTKNKLKTNLNFYKQKQKRNILFSLNKTINNDILKIFCRISSKLLSSNKTNQQQNITIRKMSNIRKITI